MRTAKLPPPLLTHYEPLITIINHEWFLTIVLHGRNVEAVGFVSLPGHGGVPGRGPWATLGAATNRPGRAAGFGEGALPGVPQGDPQGDGPG